MREQTAFVSVTNSNAGEIHNLLAAQGGYFLTAWPKTESGLTITLFDRPTLRLDERPTVSSHHTGDNASNPLDDREYRFSRAREKTGLDMLFPSLDVDGYRLTIAASWTRSQGINFVHGRYYYVPESSGLAEAFAYIFEYPFIPLDPPLTSDGIDQMIAYMLEDLETKAVVREIVAAGVAADNALGMG